MKNGGITANDAQFLRAKQDDKHNPYESIADVNYNFSHSIPLGAYLNVTWINIKCKAISIMRTIPDEPLKRNIWPTIMKEIFCVSVDVMPRTRARAIAFTKSINCSKYDGMRLDSKTVHKTHRQHTHTHAEMGDRYERCG